MGCWNSKNSFLTNRSTHEDLPTAASPEQARARHQTSPRHRTAHPKSVSATRQRNIPSSTSLKFNCVFLFIVEGFLACPLRVADAHASELSGPLGQLSLPRQELEKKVSLLGQPKNCEKEKKSAL